MSKAFTKESDGDNSADDAADAEAGALATAPGGKNYITAAGYQALRSEWLQLMDVERPKVVEAVHWAARNGDRSENGDYIYGKKRLREIDRRIHFLTKRLDIAQVVDASQQHGNAQVFFGATVTYADEHGHETTVTLVGIDEADSLCHRVSWVSPIAKALLKARLGDEVRLVTPAGSQVIEILRVDYPPPQAAVNLLPH